MKTKLIAAGRMIVGPYPARSAATLNCIQPGPKHASFAKRLKHGVRFALVRVAAAYVSLWPLRFASAVGARFGALAWSIFCGERKKALDSLAIAFPERAEAERRALGRACFAHLGRVACELACLAELDRSIDTFVDWPADSRAVLDAALARKKGVIFVSGHVGHWELLARRVALAGYPVQVIAREAGDRRMTAVIGSMRSTGGVKSIWRGRPGAAKDMLRAIKRGEILGLLLDQDTNVQSIFVPFFGREARTPRAAADLALCTGAAVVLGFCHRVGPTSFRLSIRELPVPATGGESAVVALTQALTQGIEAAIRSNPEQWVWMHRRWRSRPEEQGCLANHESKTVPRGARRTHHSERTMKLVKKFLKEPLLHFLALGAVIFALNAWREKARTTEASAARIDVTAAVVERLRAGFERQFGQAPDTGELRGLVTAHIREEVLCREALALGLDRDDTIVRRRLAQKMEFLTDDLAAAAEPEDAAAREFFAKNAARYAKQAHVSFRHVYFSQEKRGAKNEAAAREALAPLAAGANDEAMGDAFLHGFVFAERETQDITALFGSEFAARIARLREGEWSGPIESSYGLHLVRVETRGDVQPASFDSVRARVAEDFNEERRRTANREIFEKLRERYQVVVDEAAIEKAAPPPTQTAQR